MNIQIPLVSIVTPSYNQGKFIEEAIVSVINQDYPSIEYFIFDACSNDNSVDIIRKYNDKITYWISERDKGQSDAINKGWMRAKGDIFFYLNSDDKLFHSSVVSQIASIFYGDCVKINSLGNQIGYQSSRKASFRDLLFENEFGKIMWQTSSFYNAKYVRETNYLDTRLHYAMDFELALRLSKIGELICINSPIACFRVHKDQKSIIGVSIQNKETAKIKFSHNILAGLLHYFRFLKFEIFILLPRILQKWVKPKLYSRYYDSGS
jgi:glycosyltransferase involved in cell wall biosynthesis